MNRNYFILTFIMLALAVGTFFIQRKHVKQQISPEKLLWDIIQPTRYVSTDEVAKLIIQKDPSLELMDVRSASEFNHFSLPNCINVPLDSILNKSSMDYFGVHGVNVVFISNDDIKADEAWVLTKRLGFKSIYVMKGGMNRWIETIIQPKEPGEGEPLVAFERYEFRKGARLYFTGVKVESATNSKKAKVVFKRKKKTTVAVGGC